MTQGRFIRENRIMGRNMGTELYFTKMGIHSKDYGNIISRRVWECTHIKMEINMKEITMMVKSLDQVHSSKQMEVSLRPHILKVFFMVK